MNNAPTNRAPYYQIKYRKAQSHKGLVRFELQVNHASKARFDELVEAVADEFVENYDKRRRIARARTRVFDEITQGVTHEFFELKDRIAALKREITALSPQFFIKTNDKTPIPEAINALPDDPVQLKKLLAKTYVESQQAKQAVQKHKFHAEQFSKLYDVQQSYNEELVAKLKKHEPI